MKKNVLYLTLLILSITNIYSQTGSQRSFTTYYDLVDFQMASPGAFKTGLWGFDNPAMLNYNNSNFDLAFLVNDMGQKLFDFNKYGFFYSSKQSGFGIMTVNIGDNSYTDYRTSLGFGSKVFGLGLTYGWTNTSGNIRRSNNMMAVGALYRPISYLSIAGNYSFALDNRDAETVVELGIRPLGNELITLYADASQLNEQNIKDINWSAGIILEPVPGVRINARRFMKTEGITLGVNLSFGNSDLSNINLLNSDNSLISSTYGIRFGGKDRTVLEDVIARQEYKILDLSSNIKYIKNVFFDNSQTLLKILDALDEASNNKNVKGIVVNATQLSASRTMLWEIREKLKEIKSKGKKVIVFIDRANIDIYHFASVGDEVVIDPLGFVSIEGYSLGRSFYKKLLDKSDIGYEEFRYFKYKSAAENFSREEFSEGDREQRQRLVDDWYELAKNEILESRKGVTDNFDNLVNDQMGFMPEEAQQKKLVDKFDRWNNLQKFMREYDNTAGLKNIFADDMYPEPIDNKWGEDEKSIAVIYAEGACDLNTGIRARMLSDVLRMAYEKSSIKAIVLRVDSPGGDAMASDYISKLIQENKGKKPLIVSQGSVAASGGYWLSMEADKIVAAPNTITGSIGVIGAWIYDKGLKDSLGITYDYVKKGKYADLGNSFTLPFIPIGLPVRNLNKDEIEQREKMIKTLYKDFVSRVAKARKMDYEKVDEIAQGRIWTGNDALKIGLVDNLGTLIDAINLAKEAAGIPKNKKVNIKEYPTGQFFDFSALFGSIFGFNIPKAKTEFDDLKFLIENNGIPMPILSIDYWK